MYGEKLHSYGVTVKLGFLAHLNPSPMTDHWLKAGCKYSTKETNPQDRFTREVAKVLLITYGRYKMQLNYQQFS